jgi:hypothetical protein
MDFSVDARMLASSHASVFGFTVWLQSFSAPNTYRGSSALGQPCRVDSMGVRSRPCVPETRPCPCSSIQNDLARVRPVTAGLEQGAEVDERPTMSASRECLRRGRESGPPIKRRGIEPVSMKPSRDRVPGLRSFLRLLYRARFCSSARNGMPVIRRVRPLSLRQLAWPRKRSIWNAFSRLSM